MIIAEREGGGGRVGGREGGGGRGRVEGGGGSNADICGVVTMSIVKCMTAKSLLKSLHKLMDLAKVWVLPIQLHPSLPVLTAHSFVQSICQCPCGVVAVLGQLKLGEVERWLGQSLLIHVSVICR